MKLFTYNSPNRHGNFCVPLAMQNVFMRDYCAIKGWPFVLPATEVFRAKHSLVLVSLIERVSVMEADFILLPSFVLLLDPILRFSVDRHHRLLEVQFHSALERASMSLHQILELQQQSNMHNIISSGTFERILHAP